MVISCKKCFEYFLVYNGNVDDVYITVQFLDIFAKLQKLQKNSKSLQGGAVSRSQLSNLLRNNSTLTPFPVMSFPEMIWIFTCVYNATLVTLHHKTIYRVVPNYFSSFDLLIELQFTVFPNHWGRCEFKIGQFIRDAANVFWWERSNQHVYTW